MTNDESKYYSDMEDLFATPGWKTVIEEIKQEIYELQAQALEAATWEAVCEYRGKAEALAYFVNLADVIDMQKSNALL